MCGGIGSRTDFSYIFEMFDYANMRSEWYPFFHIALLNDFGSFALCTSDRLFDSSHSSTASPSLSVEVYPQCVVAVEAANYNMRHVLFPSGGRRNCSAGGLYTECTTTLGSSTVMNSMNLSSSQTENNLQTISNKNRASMNAWSCLIFGSVGFLDT